MIRLKTLLREWTGETWSSCRQWASHRTRYMSGQEKAVVTIQKSSTMFQLEYVGPSTGISLAHAKGGRGDTLHQLFNIVICEINPWLDATQVNASCLRVCQPTLRHECYIQQSLSNSLYRNL